MYATHHVIDYMITFLEIVLQKQELKLATISDVAKRAGVSTVTVSRVINNAGNVSPATRAKVERIIEELGYVPSGVAQSLRSKRTRSLALIVPDIQNQFWMTVARGVEDAAQSRGYSVSLCNTDENAVKQLHYLDLVISQRVDGVAIAPFDSDAANLNKLRQRNTPTVVIDRHIEGWDVDTITGDSISGARALVKHLADQGHTRIAILSGPTNTSTAADRILGYRVGLADAGIPYDPSLVKFGEFRSISGERLTHQLLNQDDKPTAIFAANNAIAMGVIDALDARGLRIPYDMALACFDDLPNTSRLFPFLTVVVQPAYDIGANAAQLLLSRLDASTPLPPRHVVLPTRLIVRHSCGSSLHDDDRPTISLPLRREAAEKTFLVKPITSEELRLASLTLDDIGSSLPWRLPELSNRDKSDVDRIRKVFAGETPDRVPHFELDIDHRPLFEYVLERKLGGSNGNGNDNNPISPTLTPEEQVEFAQRLGIDAVPCTFYWYPNNVYGQTSAGENQYINGTIKTWDDLTRLEPPPALADQLNTLERYLRAAEGTGVGVFAVFSSFFHSALRAIGFDDALYLIYDNRPFLERLLDILQSRHERVMQAVIDRFGADLVFIMIRDELAHQNGPLIDPVLYQEMYVPRMERFLLPVKSHGKHLMLHTAGKVDALLPMLQGLGFNGIHPVAPEVNDLQTLDKLRDKRFVLAGQIPNSLLYFEDRKGIESHIERLSSFADSAGGYMFSTSGPIHEGIPAEAFINLTQAIHKYGQSKTSGALTAHEEIQ